MFSFFGRNRAQARTPDVREIAEVMLRHREAAWVYRDGVVDEAVRRASQVSAGGALIDTLVAVFEEYEWGDRAEYEAIAAEFGLHA